jgi:hypothetical protein
VLMLQDGTKSVFVPTVCKQGPLMIGATVSSFFSGKLTSHSSLFLNVSDEAVLGLE